MTQTYEFLKQVIDSVFDHIVVIDPQGYILFANKSWIAFGRDNQCAVHSKWQGINYLQVCDEAAGAGDKHGKQAGDGIRAVIAGKSSFYLEYPCHSPRAKRWFMMWVTPLEYNGMAYYVILHQDITERKHAEEKALNMARLDGLTQIANRMYFDQFIENEWRRCLRLHQPLALAMLDIDHFKQLNDTYGHQAGDECLVKIAGVLKSYVRRPGDLCARYGGEEFVLLFGNTSLEDALAITQDVTGSIRDLKIPNENAPGSNTLTVSAGVACVMPGKDSNPDDLIKRADDLLYDAKEAGRNRIIHKAA